ncbi:PIN domain-containing protein [Sulfolobus sp. S-194]|uniref:PIN domain-containing protein n=1 Tax=Sulfolobus sp. S-194 TaxID=2512240 RepID=UPI0025707B21|nr:PIN domain-containing protein [Sulfolobus sp. S-194]
MAKLANNINPIKQKLEELKDFEIVKEELEDMIKGVEMLRKDNRSIRMLNDCIILAIAKRLNIEPATYDTGLVKRELEMVSTFTHSIFLDIKQELVSELIMNTI